MQCFQVVIIIYFIIYLTEFNFFIYYLTNFVYYNEFYYKRIKINYYLIYYLTKFDFFRLLQDRGTATHVFGSWQGSWQTYQGDLSRRL